MNPFEIFQAQTRRQMIGLGARGLGALGAASLLNPSLLNAATNEDVKTSLLRLLELANRLEAEGKLPAEFNQ